MDLIQSYFECCGADGPQDYGKYTFTNLNGPQPESCLNPETKILNTQGCSEAVQEKLQAHIAVAAGIALGAGALMVCIIISIIIRCMTSYICKVMNFVTFVIKPDNSFLYTWL